MLRMSKIAVMVMLGGSLLASGCCNAVSEKIAEKAAEKVVEKAVGGDATVSKGGVSVKTDKGSITAGVGRLARSLSVVIYTSRPVSTAALPSGR